MRKNDFHASFLWQKLGISQSDCNEIQSLLTRGLISSVSLSNKTQKCDALELIAEDLFKLSKKLSIADRISQHDIKQYSLESGVTYIKSIIDDSSKVIGVCGLPGSGKTTILNRFQDQHYPVIDEFWYDGSDIDVNGENTYDAKNDLVCDFLAQQKSVLVAGALLNPQKIDTNIFLKLSEEKRMQNICRRSNNSLDEYMCEYPEYYAMADLFRYAVQEPFADAIIRSDAVEYN